MKLIDLSHSIDPSSPLFFDPIVPSGEADASVVAGGLAGEKVQFESHTGTHLDLPTYVRNGVKTVQEMPVDHFYGSGMMIDIVGSTPILVEHLAPYEASIRQNDFLLFNTNWSRYWGDGHYFLGYPYLTEDAAEWLTRFDLKGIGIDSLSVDPMGSLMLPVHKILLEQNIVIVENLINLDLIGQESFTFSCLPLKLAKGDGSPVRAVAIIP